jgi:hypothetical protein
MKSNNSIGEISCIYTPSKGKNEIPMAIQGIHPKAETRIQGEREQSY